MAREWTCEDDILCGVNHPKNPDQPTDFELEHIPTIEIKNGVKKDAPFEIAIEVGKLTSPPDEPGHFIEWIELYSGDTFLGRTQYSASSSLPKALFKIRLTHSIGPLKAWAKCNLHGLWETKIDI